MVQIHHYPFDFICVSMQVVKLSDHNFVTKKQREFDSHTWDLPVILDHNNKERINEDEMNTNMGT